MSVTFDWCTLDWKRLLGGQQLAAKPRHPAPTGIYSQGSCGFVFNIAVSGPRRVRGAMSFTRFFGHFASNRVVPHERLPDALVVSAPDRFSPLLLEAPGLVHPNSPGSLNPSDRDAVP